MPRLRLDRAGLTLAGRPSPFSLGGLLPIGLSAPATVLTDVSLDLSDGDRLALGGDPAGVRALLRLLAGTAAATAGECRVDGDVVAIIDVERRLDDARSGRDNLDRLAGLRAGVAAELTGLGDLLDVPVRLYSPGMRGRLGFAAASAWPGDVLLVGPCLAGADRAFRPEMLRRLNRLLDSARVAVVAEPALFGRCDGVAEVSSGRLRLRSAAAAEAA